MKDIMLLSLSGEDKPGIMSSLMDILGSHHADILDIGQAVIHNTLSLGILVRLPETSGSALLKDLLFKAYEVGVTLKFTPILQDNYTAWVKQQGRPRYIITILSRRITSQHIAQVSKVVAEQKLNIDQIDRLSGRLALSEDDNGANRASIEMTVRGVPADISQMRADFMKISRNLGVDIAFQEDNVYRRSRRLVCFDMDSTLIQAEVIVELAKAAGVGEKVHEITESAMRGEIDFKESFKKRIATLKGLKEEVLQDIAAKLPVTEGAERLISTLRHHGYKTAILSGGFTYFGNYLKEKLGMDYVFANELEIKEGELTGNYIGEIVDGKRKAELLEQIALKEGIVLDQVIAVGDGANDLPMIGKAGLGIAFHAKPIVKESAQHAISHLGLDGLLYLLGFRDRDIKS